MKNLAQNFLTEKEQEKVTETVKKAELQTSGEIVPMIVSSCYDYSKARIAAALLYSLPLALFLTHPLSNYLWLDPENVYFFLSLCLPLFILFYQLIKIFPVLSRFLISKDEMNSEVEEEAIKSFFNENLYATRDANGILLFISVFEKKAWILADHGIQEKISNETWDNIIKTMTSDIVNNNRCDGLCDAIDKIGTILSEHFPYKRDDTDELHNLIIR